MRHIILCLTVIIAVLGSFAYAAADDGWQTIFDGKTFSGWKASENSDSWQIKDGAFVCNGPRSHLFYMGAERPFKNFELKCEVMTTPGSNAGIYFHTRYQEEGWPRYGFESQVNVTHKDTVKTGSLYGIFKVSDPPCQDNEYWTHHIIVDGRRITTQINGKTVVDYEEPAGKEAFSAEFERRLGSGTIAFQAHDPDSVAYFRNIRIKRLP